MTTTDWHGLVNSYADWLRQGIEARYWTVRLQSPLPSWIGTNDHLPDSRKTDWEEFLAE